MGFGRVSVFKEQFPPLLDPNTKSKISHGFVMTVLGAWTSQNSTAELKHCNLRMLSCLADSSHM